jgi:hypothetical protein
MVKKLVIAISFISLSSCDYSYHKDLGGDYVLRAVNSPVSMTIGYGDENGTEGLLPHTVYKVYWDKDNIVALRHPSDGLNQSSIENEIVEYFLIDKKKMPREVGRMKGPLTKIQIDSIINVLNIDLTKMEMKEFDDLD